MGMKLPGTFIGRLFVAVALAAATASADEPTTYHLENGRRVGQVDRVTVHLELVGNGVEPGDAKQERVEMRVAADLGYDEYTLAAATSDATTARSLRHYDEASGVLKVGKDGMSLSLRPERRTIAARTGTGDLPAVLYSPDGPLTRQELELIEVMGNSLLLDQLLPAKPLALEKPWPVSEQVLARLLDLRSVGHSDVGSKLVEVTPAVARFEMQGAVDGTVHGVATEVMLKAKYRFDRRRRRIDWFAMVVKEQRKISPVGVGLDVTAQVVVTIAAQPDAATLPQTLLTGIGDSLDPDQLLIEFQPEEGHWSLLHDRRWFVTRDDHDLTVLRMMDGGDFLAQCNLAPLPTVTRDKLPTLDQFKQDVEKRLAEQSGTIIKASQRENKHGYRLFRVLATGEVGGSSRPPSKSGDAAKGDTNASDEGRVKGLPVQWRYYLVADAQGHRAVLAFTLEDELAARVGDADERLVDGVRFATERPAEPSADRRSDRAQTLRPKAERSPR